MGNFAAVLAELEKFESAIQVCTKSVEQLLKRGTTKDLGRMLSNITFIMKYMGEKDYVSRGYQALDILKLTKQQYRYELLEQYMKK